MSNNADLGHKPTAIGEEVMCFFRGEFIPLADAKVSIATHALNYGTGCFEGIRAYWNKNEQRLFALKLREHYVRMINNCKILKITIPYSVEELCDITVKLLAMNNYQQDVYIRPLAFKATSAIGVRLTGIEDGFTIFTVPMGDYLDTQKGLHLTVSPWLRIDDNIIPGRAKVTGGYVNAALAVDDAHAAGFDDAVMLNSAGHVSEATTSNLFIVRDGQAITSCVTEGILEGITRRALLGMCADLGIPTQIRPIDRTELYISDEIFLVGTGVQVAPVTKVDHRPVGTGKAGELTLKIQKAYFAAARGDDPKYKEAWLTPVPKS